MKRVIQSLLLALLGLLAACSAAPDLTQPPVISYGQDVCDRCNMIISEERYAAAYWTGDGTARRFDDIGGMMAYHREHGEEVVSFWVHDYDSRQWIPAEEAFFVLAPQLITPMGYGVIAVGSEARATALGDEQGAAQLLTFEELLAAPAWETAGGHDHGHMDHGTADGGH